MSSGLTLASFGDGYRALVIGASGALGTAFCQHLNQDPRCASVRTLGRDTVPKLDLEQPETIASAAAELAGQAPFHLIIHAAGLLHRDQVKPEKLQRDRSRVAAGRVPGQHAGAGVAAARLLPLLAPQGAMAMLSAKVGSIGDNRLGGWYAYRASKAALNMLIKTAAIELSRTRPQSRLLSLHPGTVVSPLSQPFRGASSARPADIAAAQLLSLIDTLTPADSGHFFAYDGERLPW